tara:strand:+ start:185 stop:421 length:237 start_codon:yes stop_codon:yes gene_type:complete
MEKKIEKMSYEEAIIELEKIVQKLESGEASLDESIELYSKGSELKNYCEKKLHSAEEKISQISKDQENKILNLSSKKD